MIKSRKRKGDKIEVYCRKCKQYKSETNFYTALDTNLDSNGFMSVCKDCCSTIFVSAFNVEMDIKKATFVTCKTLNMAYVTESIDAAIAQVDTNSNGGDLRVDSFFGVYKAKLGNYFRFYKDVPQTFETYGLELKFNEKDEAQILEEEGIDFSKYLKTTWGSGLSIEDYNFLESSIGEWKRTHKCETNSELVLMQEICHLQLAVRKAREQSLDTKVLVKSLQELIKTANLSPAQANMANASRGNEVFGMWIKDIEQLEPAEWWNENRDLFKDVDNLSQYFEDFITRPIKNFITRSRDFVIKSGDDSSDIELKESEEDGE